MNSKLNKEFYFLFLDVPRRNIYLGLHLNPFPPSVPIWHRLVKLSILI